jgi:hypothetical protein
MKSIGFSICVLCPMFWNLLSCQTADNERFGANTPIQSIPFRVQLPTDQVYEPSPDPAVLVGRKRTEPGSFVVSGYDRASGQKRWQLPFPASVVGHTDRQVVVYATQTAQVHFVEPKTGQITRTITPAPNPLQSKSGLELGMAFTNDLYLTTQALYTQVNDGNRIDESFPIGITAKTWAGNQKRWFVPPVRQILTLTHRPIISGNVVLLINPMTRIDGGHSYQLVSLDTGAERRRVDTPGEFVLLNDHLLLEKTANYLRCFDPFLEQERWRLNGSFGKSAVYVTGSQLSVVTTLSKNARTVRQRDVATGWALKTFTLPFLQETVLQGVYLPADGSVWLRFATEMYRIPEERPYDYWVGYNEATQKPLWRTDYKSAGVGSLIPLLAP